MHWQTMFGNLLEVDYQAFVAWSFRLNSSSKKNCLGLDISFIVGDEMNACACFVILNRQLELVYQDVQMVKLTAPYVPGFLAFREAQFLIDLISKQR